MAPAWLLLSHQESPLERAAEQPEGLESWPGALPGMDGALPGVDGALPQGGRCPAWMDGQSARPASDLLSQGPVGHAGVKGLSAVVPELQCMRRRSLGSVAAEFVRCVAYWAAAEAS